MRSGSVKAKMRIAVVHNLPAGGQKRALFELVKRLSAKHQLDLFILSKTNENFLPLTKFVQHVYRFPYHQPEKFPYSKKQSKKLPKQLRRQPTKNSAQIFPPAASKEGLTRCQPEL